MAAYYNELNAQAAANIRARMAAGLIAPGEVDERSIADVRPDDLRGFEQCHFFAGGGAWSYALRLGGWPDDRPVWTGSCPCQPFSTAGKRKGFGDDRHLWPTWYALIRECGPVVVLGEQVGGSGGRAWVDLVHDDMEGSGYAVGAIDTPACSVGAPHIRQRLYWVAYALQPGRPEGWAGAGNGQTAGSGGVDGLADTSGARSQGNDGAGQRAHAQRAATERSGNAGGVGDADYERCKEQQVCLRTETHGWGSSRVLETPRGGQVGGMAHAERDGDWSRGSGCAIGSASCVQRENGERERFWSDASSSDDRVSTRPGPTNGHWRDADWLGCRDGKWRPAQPGTFPLAHGVPGRVGRLREHGNAIVAPQAAEFVRIVMEAA